MQVKIITTVFLTTLTCVVLSSSAQTKNPIEGNTFSIKLQITGAERRGMPWTKDEISFEGGKLISKVMGVKEGFPPFDCTITVDSSSSPARIHFTASGHNTGVSDINWEGDVTGKKITGTTVWTNANGPQTQTFSGTMMEKK